MPRTNKALPWGVLDKHGVWCALAAGESPDEAVGSVDTACGEYVILPHNYEQRIPSCKHCLRQPGYRYLRKPKPKPKLMLRRLQSPIRKRCVIWLRSHRRYDSID